MLFYTYSYKISISFLNTFLYVCVWYVHGYVIVHVATSDWYWVPSPITAHPVFKAGSPTEPRAHRLSLEASEIYLHPASARVTDVCLLYHARLFTGASIRTQILVFIGQAVTDWAISSAPLSKYLLLHYIQWGFAPWSLKERRQPNGRASL